MAILVWSGIGPKDQFTWFLEVLPAIIGLIVLAITFKRFEFTKLTYVLILVHCCILMIGGHYTYAEVPLFDWISEIMGHSRNNYDKVGHFAQGFVPAVIAREILLRNHVVNQTAWRNVIIVALCMAMSVSYEFIEWFVADLTAENAEAFLGTQGYVWDTQADMLAATIGAIVTLLTMTSVHDKQIAHHTNS